MGLDADTGEMVAAPDAVYWELEPGERPVWHGRPNAVAFVATTTRWGRTFMGLPFVAVGFILTPIAHPLGILFVLVGGGMLAAPLWNWLKARNTIYVVTNHRIMVIEHVLRQSVASFGADSIGRVERRQSHCGCGSLVFCRIETRVNREDGYNHSMVEEKGFFGLRDVGAAWQVIMNLKNRSA